MSADTEWRKVPGFIGYEISNYGEARSMGKTANQYSTGGIHLLKSFRSPDNYIKYTFSKLINGKYRQIRQGAHRLVALAFLPTVDLSLDVAHLDGNKENNHVSNLKWCSRKENDSHKDSHGTRAKGERSGKAKLKTQEVLKIIELHEEQGIPQTVIAKKFGVSSVAVSDIIIGKSWVHVTNRKGA